LPFPFFKIKNKGWKEKNMRMWKVNPELMCNQHLLGEHVEMHMFVGTLNKSKSILGYLENGLVEVHNIRKRHDELATEMAKRGFKHNSPLPKFKYKKAGEVDSKSNLLELRKRCHACKQLKGGLKN
jgi:hypothetical protein